MRAILESPSDVVFNAIFVAPFFDTWTGDMQFYTPNVREGDMILFPSYIMHQALPNKSEKRRTVISYNLRGYIEGVKATL